MKLKQINHIKGRQVINNWGRLEPSKFSKKKFNTTTDQETDPCQSQIFTNQSH